MTTLVQQLDTVPVNLIEAVNKAIERTFEGMFGTTEIKPAPDASEESEGIVGLISFVGDITWSLAMMFPQTSVANLAYKFAGFEIAYDSADMGDVVGELANVLAGVVCGELENRGISSQMSLPTVTRGRQVELLLGGHLIATRFSVTTPSGNFDIRLIVSKTNTPAAVLV